MLTRIRSVTALLLLAGVAALPVGAPALAASPRLQEEPAPSAESPLKRKDIPPDGVDSLFGFGQGAGSASCRFRSDGSLQTAFGGSECFVEIADEVYVAFEGFAPGGDVDAEFTRPDGTVERRQDRANELGNVGWDWAPLPGDPLGWYAVVATQRDRRVTGSFAVRSASEPLALVRPQIGAPGTTFRLYLAGFTPGQAVPVRLYRDLGPNFSYVTALPPVVVNERGEAALPVRTAADDEESAYIVETEPRSGGAFAGRNRRFAVSRSGDVGAARAGQGDAALVEAIVEDANRVWARVVAKDGAPIAELQRAFDERALNQMVGEVEAMRAAGRYQEARLAAPIVIRDVTKGRAGCSDCLEAVVLEEWDSQLYNADGSLVEAGRWREEWRYVMKWTSPRTGGVQPGDPGYAYRYRIVEAELLWSE